MKDCFPTPPAGRSISPDRFRLTMGQFATGVAVVTALDGGQRFGMTVNSLTSVSLDPPLLLVCPRRGSATGVAIQRSRTFCVNVLRAGQEDVCRRFVGADAARFEGLAIDEGTDGLPIIPGALAHIFCALEAVHPGGDHDILLGRVTDCAAEPGEPLLFHEGRLCRRAAA